ncbi:MAG: glycosyl transferase family 1 [Acidocella sp. 20-63-7]|nr:MAG: glycosyl transferase family 1 [Acidocella sp. 20-63-7]HQT46523.1 glycosyltransferase family 1 protein [Acidocella sp.]
MNGLYRAGHAAWRMLPRALRRRAMTGFAAALARRPDPVPPAASNGVVVAGDTLNANGLAESARIMHQVIAEHGLARGFIPLGLPGNVPENPAPVPEDAALLAVVNANILPIGLLRLPRRFIARRRVIGMWAWELPLVPPSWVEGARFVHEIWAPSRFTADALEALAPGRVRVVPYPLAAVVLPVAGGRADFGLPEGMVVVLTVFNLASSMVRKNPMGAIAAFRAAFGDSREHLLVLKLSATEAYTDDLREIQAAIGNAPNIRLMTQTLPEAALRGLIAAADIVLSLHRSEGFGLIPATAMLLGRAVIATGWSGNLAFMTPECAALVSHRLVPVVDPRGTYDLPGARWADPDIEDAAQQLRRLAGDAPAREALAQAGLAYARGVLGAAPVLRALAANGIA